MADEPVSSSRRFFLGGGLRALTLLALGGAAGVFAARGSRGESRWQIDPHKCTACGKCATLCVQTPSAVRAVHAYDMCGYCNICTGFFEPNAKEYNTGAENQVCPTNAIMRSFIEDPYYEYVIDEGKCVACAKCVKGCTAFGNGSIFLQIMHHRCVNCNQCTIARDCPAQAIVRVPAEQPYLLKNRAGK